ncbi:MAG: hypothetical protein LR015_07495 [Verrucomicrobia bacterium]|nr:hypothetical protein [Verrucomicrobiota bacterium]
MFDSLLMRLFPDLTFTEQQAVNWIESHSDLQGLQLEIKRASGWELWAGELLVANRDCLLAGQSSGAVLRFERESKKMRSGI